MKWINCDDRLPEDGQQVLVYLHEDATWIEMYGHRVRIAVVAFCKGRVVGEDDRGPIEEQDQHGNNERPYCWDEAGPGQFFGQDVTHWMPIPDAPE
jgi:hypothetical protein